MFGKLLTAGLVVASTNHYSMKIVYLYSELGPYNIPVFQCLTKTYRARIHVVHWDHKKLKPYIPATVENVSYYKRSEYSAKEIYRLAKSIDPDIIYISGWMDKEYLPTARRFKKKGIPVVVGFDDQWHGNLRQRLGAIAFPFLYKNYFSHAWVSGPRQYEFAKRLGFENRHIIIDMLSCDYNLFNEAGEALIQKRTRYPRTFFYVGNFSEKKGTDILLKAFKQYRRTFGGDWKLICIGNGEMWHLLENESGIEVIDYMYQREIVNLCARLGVFVLPSRREPWGVVVHEFATAGLPLLLSDSVGAKDTFLIEGYNGISYANNSVAALSRAMFDLSIKSESELLEMGSNSRKLASRITPATSAASFVSIVNCSRIN